MARSLARAWCASDGTASRAPILRHYSSEAVMGMVNRIKSLLSKKGPKPTPRPQPPSGPYRPGV